MANRTNGQQSTRREFLKTTVAAATIAAPWVVTPGLLAAPNRPGPNDRIGIGFVGSGHRARLLMSQIPEEGRIVALCDVWRRRCEEALKEKKADWAIEKDHRALLDRKDIDAVIVPTTDHARTHLCIRACEAGKDVYAEKPLTLTIREGRALVVAARKHGRIFQVGSQQRSMEMNRFACEFVRNGGLGRLQSVLGCNYTGPGTCDDAGEEPVPADLDWDAWCGATPLKPYHSRRHLGWMGCRDYSGGEMTNWGAHGIDQIQWALGADDAGPVEISPEGQGMNAPVHLRYENGVIVKLELAQGPMGGAIFIGKRGKIEIDRNRFKADPVELVKDPPPAQKAEIWEGPGWQAKYHIGNWLECIKSRKTPVADVEIGHRSISVCHLANIARRVGRKLSWDPVKEVCAGDDEANALLERPRRKGYELPTIA